MFEKSLQDLVKGIRANKREPSAFISQAIAECKVELRSTDPFVKAQAIRKLTYLQMTGYDVSWASFAVVECMSQPRFAHKRIGYLAACQCFNDATDVVLLTTNLLKKEFQSQNQYEVGLAVNCLANIVTRDLARDLLQDLVLLMSHTKPYVRKKAVSAMFKLYMRYPQALRLTFERVKERLADGEASVVSCAVNIVCELANKNPNNYLSMAPQASQTMRRACGKPPLTLPGAHRRAATRTGCARVGGAAGRSAHAAPPRCVSRFVDVIAASMIERTRVSVNRGAMSIGRTRLCL